MEIVQEPAYRKRIGYQAALLGGFSTIATILLVMGNLSTKDAILERQQEDLQTSLNQVVAARYYTNRLLDQPLEIIDSPGKHTLIYRGTAFDPNTGKQIVSTLAWEIVGQGYAGEMRFIIGVDRKANILGVRVLSHAETPGLGDKMEVARDDWILGFNGLSLGNPPEIEWKVDKDGGRFDSFTGATITPRGVVAAVVSALKFFDTHQAELLTLPIDHHDAMQLNAEGISKQAVKHTDEVEAAHK